MIESPLEIGYLHPGGATWDLQMAGNTVEAFDN